MEKRLIRLQLTQTVFDEYDQPTIKSRPKIKAEYLMNEDEFKHINAKEGTIVKTIVDDLYNQIKKQLNNMYIL